VPLFLVGQGASQNRRREHRDPDTCLSGLQQNSKYGYAPNAAHPGHADAPRSPQQPCTLCSRSEAPTPGRITHCGAKGCSTGGNRSTGRCRGDLRGQRAPMAAARFCPPCKLHTLGWEHQHSPQLQYEANCCSLKYLCVCCNASFPTLACSTAAVGILSLQDSSSCILSTRPGA
jgi:hypothetical protein